MKKTVEIKGVSNFIEDVAKTDKERRLNNIGKNPHQLLHDLKKLSYTTPSKVERGQEMSKTLKIRSNSARGKVISFDNVVIHFDNDGIGKVSDVFKEAIELEMIRKPGRYQWVAEHAPAVETSEEIELDITEELEEALKDIEKEETKIPAVEEKKPTRGRGRPPKKK